MLLSQKLLEREYGSPLDRSLQKILLEYYKLIDEHKIDEVVNLFSKTAHYLRCGEVYSGIEAIEKFYKNERKIRGSHEIENLWVIDQTGIVEGIFTGKGVDDQPKKVGFADFFTFNKESKIQDRHTYLMLGSSYVRE
ncbi:hypothetical protein STA3757_35870 [Stanieria sp. NIES-3757]|nr:hypothetical protein STA3757_35870 [Stanieria sp. NIES-3757]